MGSPSASFSSTGALTVKQDKPERAISVDADAAPELRKTGDSNLGVVAPSIGSPFPVLGSDRQRLPERTRWCEFLCAQHRGSRDVSDDDFRL